MGKIFLSMSNDVLGCGNRIKTLGYTFALSKYCGFSFDYVSANVVQGTDTTPHKAVGIYFDEPIGGSCTKVAGSIEVTGFWNRFRSVAIPKMGVTAPLFSIVSHNSAHHMAYVLARYAFCNIAKNRGAGFLVITFDEHTDQHTGFTEHVTCQNYVRPLLLRDIVNVVMHIGWGTPKGVCNDINLFTKANVTKAAKKGNLRGQTYPCRMDSRKTVEKNIIDTINQHKIQHVYITVDRDFMKGSYTPYGDRGENFPDAAREVVERTVKTLIEQNIKFTGFDIHGLPCNRGRSDELRNINLSTLKTSRSYHKVPNFGAFSPEHYKAIQIAFHDVKYYYDLVSSVF